MAVKWLMDITMISALILLLLFVPTTSARYLSGEAIETQPGITAMDGISPVPTEAPGLNGIPKELRKRATQTSTITSLPTWCGSIHGDDREFFFLRFDYFLNWWIKIKFYYLIWGHFFQKSKYFAHLM